LSPRSCADPSTPRVALEPQLGRRPVAILRCTLELRLGCCPVAIHRCTLELRLGCCPTDTACVALELQLGRRLVNRITLEWPLGCCRACPHGSSHPCTRWHLPPVDAIPRGRVCLQHRDSPVAAPGALRLLGQRQQRPAS
jgi:hypothetical protein